MKTVKKLSNKIDVPSLRSFDMVRLSILLSLVDDEMSDQRDTHNTKPWQNHQITLINVNEE